jgi:two-component system sensor histidine kinase/response regulator
MADDGWYRRIVEGSPGLIGIHDLEGTIRFMNPAAAGALGYQPADMIGQNFADFIAPAVRPFFAPALERLRTEGKGEGIVLVLARDGSQRRWWYRHVLLDIPGEPPLALGDSTDVTDLHPTDEALQESEQRFRFLAENIHQVFWVRDPRTSQIVYISPAFERVWGRDREWLIEQPFNFLETIHPDDRGSILGNFARSGAGEATQMEYRIQRPDGGERWIASHAFPVRDPQGEIARIVAITEDITERKRAEAALREAKETAEEATRAKSQLLAHVSHEVRTPLQIILGLAEMLLETPLTPEQRDEIERITRAVATLNTLAQDLLDFSKIEARKLELRAEPFVVREVVQAALEPFADIAKKKRLRLETQVADDVPRDLVGDADRLRQVLTNLVGNAHKFTDRGEIALAVTTASRDDATVELRFSVRDTGSGISAADQQRIFEPFSQAHASTKHDYGGAGLGLAICAQLVQLMGGSLGVESREGRGSTFLFTARFGSPGEIPSQ